MGRVRSSHVGTCDASFFHALKGLGMDAKRLAGSLALRIETHVGRDDFRLSSRERRRLGNLICLYGETDVWNVWLSVFCAMRRFDDSGHASIESTRESLKSLRNALDDHQAVVLAKVHERLGV